jgi:hypothetical protein
MGHSMASELLRPDLKTTNLRGSTSALVPTKGKNK